MISRLRTIYLLIVGVPIFVGLIMFFGTSSFYLSVQMTLTALLVLITAYYARQNKRMVKEMKKTREAELTPYLVFQMKEFSNQKYFSVRNVGRGPIFSILLEAGIRNSPTTCSMQKYKIDFLDANQSANVLFSGGGKALSYNGEGKARMVIGIKYDSLLKEKVEIPNTDMKLPVLPGNESEFVDARRRRPHLG